MRLASLRQRTAFRLALAFGVLFIATFVASGAIMYHMLQTGLVRQIDLSLREMNTLITSTYAPADMEDLVTTLNSYAALQSTRQGVYSLTDPQGNRLAGNFTAPRLPEGISSVSSQELTLPGKARYRVQVSALGDYRLLIGRSFEDSDKLLGIVFASLGWAAAIAIVTAVGGGFLLAGRAQRRLDSVANAMRDVSQGRLDARIPLRGTGDDIDRVSVQINGALERLSGLVEGMRQVSADMAHELKTPLNRLRLTLDEAIQGYENGADIGDLLADVKDESDQINATFEALLRISQIEAGARRQRFAPVDLKEVLSFVGEVYAGVAEDRNQVLTVRADSEATVVGDRELLVQLVVNLVENSIRHCPEETRIELALEERYGNVVLTVADNGPGIPAAERDKVFRRLYRLDKSRTTPGAGLGLSLVKAVIDLHAGRITAGDNDPGLKVTVELPSARGGTPYLFV